MYVQVSVWGDEHVLVLDSDDAQSREYAKNHETVYSKWVTLHGLYITNAVKIIKYTEVKCITTKLQLALKHRFELCGSTYTCIFFSNYLDCFQFTVGSPRM